MGDTASVGFLHMEVVEGAGTQSVVDIATGLDSRTGWPAGTVEGSGIAVDTKRSSWRRWGRPLSWRPLAAVSPRAGSAQEPSGC